MAGALNGIGGQQQQIPLATPFQPGQKAAQVPAEDDRQAKTDKVPFQDSRAREPDSGGGYVRQSLATEGDPGREKSRGSVVDVTV